MSDEKVVRTDAPIDVDFTGTKYVVDHTSVRVGDEFIIDDHEEIVHTELREDGEWLDLWFIKRKGKTAFVPPNNE